MQEIIPLTLAHSPDSDDAFMFWALASRRVIPDGIDFRHVLADIQTLNNAAIEGLYDVSAISVHAYPYVAANYILLNMGASVGDGYGPRVVARENISQSELNGRVVGIPGGLTTAALVLKLAFPGVRTTEMSFDHVTDAVSNGEVDAGVLIHEGQITFEQMGLHLVTDLGKWWKDTTGLPLPLGANVVRKSLGEDIIEKAASAIRDSIQAGLENREAALRYAAGFGRELKAEEVDKFVGMYVNDYTLDWGETGREAVRELLGRAKASGIVDSTGEINFTG
ncbi:MAG TPA: ABC transporter substrate-binding protein [Firmicutes bacterium]|nr:ABC transporter substrate-binding protein [Bacillota bacterium]